MPDHDPLCPYHGVTNPENAPQGEHCECAIIAKVRSQREWFSKDLAYQTGFEAGLLEAEKRVDRMLWVFGMSKELVMSTIRGKQI